MVLVLHEALGRADLEQILETDVVARLGNIAAIVVADVSLLNSLSRELEL